MKSREDDRLRREKEITISLKGEKNKSSLLELEKHLTKFVRKMLTLTATDQNETKKNHRAFLIQSYPICMHLAQIMEERTDSEKEIFGKVTFTE